MSSHSINLLGKTTSNAADSRQPEAADARYQRIDRRGHPDGFERDSVDLIRQLVERLRVATQLVPGTTPDARPGARQGGPVR